MQALHSILAKIETRRDYTDESMEKIKGKYREKGK